MVLKAKPDDAYDFRNLLEAGTFKMTADGDNELCIASIAISLKRIADSLEPKQTFSLEETFDYDKYRGHPPRIIPARRDDTGSPHPDNDLPMTGGQG
jgi:hypothetical protein